MIDEATLQHFILGMMMALFYPIFKRLKYPYLGLILIHPFIIEGIQFFMPDRTPDTADALVGLVCIFRLIPATDSGRSRPPIPEHSGHPVC
jgi:hypothetical protein